MDEKFLEFWGNLLINAASSKKQSDDLFRWMRMGFPDFSEKPQKNVSGFDDMFATFRRLYGLDTLSDKNAEYDRMREKALKDFRHSFKEYLSYTGFVPQKEHLALMEKYEQLKAKCADQEETIEHLNTLLKAKKKQATPTPSAEMPQQLHDMFKSQGELFQKMVKDFSQCFNSTGEAINTATDKKMGEKDNDAGHDENDGSESDG